MYETAWGAEFRTLGPMASIRQKKNPWCTSRGGVGCRIQDLGICGCRWWKTVDFLHSAGTARAQRTVRPNCCGVPCTGPVTAWSTRRRAVDCVPSADGPYHPGRPPSRGWRAIPLHIGPSRGRGEHRRSLSFLSHPLMPWHKAYDPISN